MFSCLSGRFMDQTKTRSNGAGLDIRRSSICCTTRYTLSYAYGRYRIDHRRWTTGKDQGRFRASIDDWKVLIHGKLPAFITWEKYLTNISRLRENCSQFETTGAARDGESLLAGIIYCGHCGKRMAPHYKGGTKPVAYVCSGDYPAGGVSKCQRIASRFVDDIVAEQVLIAIQPASLELSLQATEEIREERSQIHKHSERRLQSAASNSDRARRQYDAVEPGNRSVASELERRWEEALRAQRDLQEEYDRFLRDQTDDFSQEDIAAVERLAADIPRLWNDLPLFSVDHKQIVRYLIDRVVVEIEGTSEVVDVAIRWKGGFENRHETIRSVARYHQLKDFERLNNRVNEMWRSGHSTTAIAEALNKEGFRTTTVGKKYTRHTVRKLLDSWGLTKPLRPQIPAEMATLNSNEWWLIDLSCKLGIDRSTPARWCRCSWVHARQLPGQCLWWIVWADQDECDRLRKFYGHGRGCHRHDGGPYPPELKTPESKPNAGPCPTRQTATN
jgi:hypothetical protein